MININRIIYFFIVLCTILMGCQNTNERNAARGGIIAMTPSLSEVVWNLEDGGQNTLMATSPFTADARADGLLRVQSTGSLETITSLHPSLVLAHPSDTQLIEKLRQLNIPTIAHGMDTLVDIENTIKDVGRFLHKDKKAEDVVQALKRELDENANKYHRTSDDEILIIVDRLDARMLQFYIAQGDAFIVDLVRGCGYTPLNPMQNASDWVRIDAETLISLNPKYILFLSHSVEDANDVRAKFRENYANLDAVKNGRIIVYENPEISVPGPEMGKRQQRLCEYMKGEAY